MHTALYDTQGRNCSVISVCLINFLSLVCPNGIGIESGSALPAGVKLSASSEEPGKLAIKGRLNNGDTWCAASTNNGEYLSLDLGRQATVTGVAIQGDVTAANWVKTFHVKHGTSVESMATYQENGTHKVSLFSKVPPLRNLILRNSCLSLQKHMLCYQELNRLFSANFLCADTTENNSIFWIL